MLLVYNCFKKLTMNFIVSHLLGRYTSASTHLIDKVILGLNVLAALLLSLLTLYLILELNFDPQLCDGIIDQATDNSRPMPGVRCPNCLRRGVEQ